MDMDKTTEMRVENSSEEETSLIDDLTQTDEGNAGDTGRTDVEKKEGEVNPYEAKLKEAEAEIARQREVIEHKNRAIQAQKRNKRQEVNEEDEPTEEEEEISEPDNIDKSYVDQKFEQVALDGKLEKISSDDSERKLIRHHYNHSIIKTGDMDKDLNTAAAIANAHVVERYRQNRASQSENEREMTHFSAGVSRGATGTKSASQNNSHRKAVESLLDKIDPNAKKYL